MNIGHITYNYYPKIGGAEFYLERLFHQLEKRGMSQRVYQINTGIKKNNLIRVPFPHRLVKNTTLGRPLYNLLINTKINKLLKENVLIVHYTEHFPSVLWHRHTISLSHGVAWDSGNKSDIVRKKIAQFAYKKSKAVIGNDSHYFREMGIPLDPGSHFFEELRPGKWLIPNCVDTNEYKPGLGDANLKKLNPIFVPRNIFPGRGIMFAIKAYAHFVREYPESTLVIAGDFPDSKYKNKVFDLINELNLIGKVLFLGKVSSEKMIVAYRSSKLTLVPSIRSEGTSLSALESMACGTPVLATNIGGLSDLPCEKSNIDIKEFANKMKKIYLDKKKYAEDQRKKVVNIFNLENWTDAWIKVIKSMS